MLNVIKTYRTARSFPAPPLSEDSTTGSASPDDDETSRRSDTGAQEGGQGWVASIGILVKWLGHERAQTNFEALKTSLLLLPPSQCRIAVAKLLKNFIGHLMGIFEKIGARFCELVRTARA